MNKSELITDLESIYAAVGSPQLLETVDGVGWYIVNVFETGKSDLSKKETGYRKNINFYVIDEGGAGEAAYYSRSEPVNSVNEDVTTASGDLISVSKIYSSPSLTSRTRAAILCASLDIINEAPETVNHAKRLLWAGAALLNIEDYTKAMMSFVATNATIQSAGGTATDNDLKYVVNSNIDNCITIFGL